MKTKLNRSPKCRAYNILMDDEADKLHREIMRDFRSRGVENPRSSSSATTVFARGEFAHQHNFCLLEHVCDEYETRMGLAA